MSYHNWNELSESTQRMLSSQEHTPTNTENLNEGGAAAANAVWRALRAAGRLSNNPINNALGKPVGAGSMLAGAYAIDPATTGVNAIDNPDENPYGETSSWNPFDWGIRYLRGKDWKPDWMKSEQIVRDIVRNNQYLSEGPEYITEDDKVFALLQGSQQVFFEQNGRYANPQELNEVWENLAEGGLLARLGKGIYNIGRGIGRWMVKPQRNNFYIPGGVQIPLELAINDNIIDAMSDSANQVPEDDEGAGGAGGGGRPGGGGNTIMPIGSDYVGPRNPGGGRRFYN